MTRFVSALVAALVASTATAFMGSPVATRRSRAASKRATAGISMYWHVFPRDYSDSDFFTPGRSFAGSVLTKEYHIEPGQHQQVGKMDLPQEWVAQAPHVDAAQCVLQVAEDGSCMYAYAQGTSPTGWRTNPNEEWRWMQPGESVALESGHKVSLDCNNPEAAVYKCEKAGRFLVDDYINSVNGVGSVNLYGGQQLPPGWVAQTDPQSGQTYYQNQQTGQTQWEAPR